MGISPNGQYVCGYYQCIINTAAFVYDTQTRQFITIPLGPGFYDAIANDVNDAGVVVGTGSRTNIGQRGFVYRLSSGQWTELLPLPEGIWSGANAINASGVVCGFRSIGPGVNPQTAFIWTPQDGFTDLGLINGQSTSASDINDGGVVTGHMAINGVAHPFLWKEGQITDLGTLFGNQTLPFALNNRNEVVGQSALTPAATSAHSFIYSGSMMSDLGTLSAHANSRAFGIATNGLVVGCSFKATVPDDKRAVIWRDNSVTDLNTLLAAGPRMFLRQADAVDENEQIVATAIPEPPTAQIAVVLTPVYASPSDITNDCRVNVNDLLLVINEWGKRESVADINRDKIVDVDDLFLVVQEWAPF